MSISEIIEKVKTDMCDNYCKYPAMDPPEGKEMDWMIMDDDSPCMKCPLNDL